MNKNCYNCHYYGGCVDENTVLCYVNNDFKVVDDKCSNWDGTECGDINYEEEND